MISVNVAWGLCEYMYDVHMYMDSADQTFFCFAGMWLP